MCGRYYVPTEDEIIEMREIINAWSQKQFGDDDIARELDREVGAPQMQRDLLTYPKVDGEACPSNTVPVITKDGIDHMIWGYMLYVYDPKKGSSKPKQVINAKSETVEKLKSFSKDFQSNRIVVPTKGFYEWTHEGTSKKAVDRYLFRLVDEDIMYLAGICQTYVEPTTGQIEQRFVIITTAANGSMEPFHDRMPLYIGRDEIQAWLFDDEQAREFLVREQPELVATLAQAKRKTTNDQMTLF